MRKRLRVQILAQPPAAIVGINRAEALRQWADRTRTAQRQGTRAIQQWLNGPPQLRQNSIWPAMDRSATSAVSRASSTISSESLTGWLITVMVAFCYQSCKPGNCCMIVAAGIAPWTIAAIEVRRRAPRVDRKIAPLCFSPRE